MSINRYNYETYFLLYIDRELSADEMTAVEDFVQEHADLAEELRLLQETAFKPADGEAYPNKQQLLKQDGQQLLNQKNYEEYFILYHDNELNEQERKAVESFVQEHPELARTFEILQQVKLYPENTVFANKEQLYRHEEEKTVRKILPRWIGYAAAAMIMLIAGLIWMYKPVSKVTERMAQQDNIKVENKTAKSVVKSTTRPFASQDQQRIAESTQDKKRENTISTNLVVKKSAKLRRENNEVAKEELKMVKIKAETTSIENIKTIARPAELQKEIVVPVTARELKTEQSLETTIQTVSLPANENSDEVYIASIPVNHIPQVKGLLRKASRLANKVSEIRNASHHGLLIGNVEIAFQ